MGEMGLHILKLTKWILIIFLNASTIKIFTLFQSNLFYYSIILKHFIKKNSQGNFLMYVFLPVYLTIFWKVNQRHFHVDRRE